METKFGGGGSAPLHFLVQGGQILIGRAPGRGLIWAVFGQEMKKAALARADPRVREGKEKKSTAFLSRRPVCGVAREKKEKGELSTTTKRKNGITWRQLERAAIPRAGEKGR